MRAPEIFLELHGLRAEGWFFRRGAFPLKRWAPIQTCKSNAPGLLSFRTERQILGKPLLPVSQKSTDRFRGQIKPFEQPAHPPDRQTSLCRQNGSRHSSAQRHGGKYA